MNPSRPTLKPHPRRGGAVIIVVLSLMATLVFLGLFFFNWTSQEVANAELFADPDVSGYKIDPDPIFDQAAEQLIVGTRSADINSALWGGVYSMLAQQLGRIDGDTLAPVDWSIGIGQGVQMVTNDLNNDSRIDPNTDDVSFRYVHALNPSSQSQVESLGNMRWNYSALATAQPIPDLPIIRPNVDYTYPDHNSMFLAHDEESPVNLLNDDPATASRRILIPSFFRPQLFPQYRGVVVDPSSDTTPNTSYLNLYTDGAHRAQVFRPHRQHLYPTTPTPTQRYLTTPGTVAQSGDTTRQLGVFPFPQTADDAYMGIFSSQLTDVDSTLLDVDLDGDGKKDSIYMDLDLPLLRLPSGDEYLPMVSFKVMDADGLLNLNLHGNRQGADKLGRALDGTEPISVSNLGMSRSEVNPLWALSQNMQSSTVTPAERLALRNVRDRFNLDSAAIPNRMQLANLEFEMLLSGWAPKSDHNNPVLGRYGDRYLVITSQDSTTANDVSNAVSGIFQEDLDGDNGRYGKDTDFPGVPLPNLNQNLKYPGFVHPLSPVGLGLRPFGADNFGYLSGTPGAGTTIVGGRGGQRKLGRWDAGMMTSSQSPMRFPQYQGFLSTRHYRDNLQSPQFETDYLANLLLNEDDETIVEQSHNYFGTYDKPFSPSETAALHLGAKDATKLKVSSRVGTLAMANLGVSENPTLDKIRSRFTTISWDRLEFNVPFPPSRLSAELGVDSDGYSTFPPPAPSVLSDPFRPELRALLQTSIDKQYNLQARQNRPIGQFRDVLRHRLNLNGILVRADSNQGDAPDENGSDISPTYRQLTPHPTLFNGGTPANADRPMHHNNSAPPVLFSDIQGDPYAQEWWARYDRQRLARDIYCLLWVIGRGEDGSGAVVNPTVPQAREMAQFAVNLVDAMDRDNVITRFEFDPDLSDLSWDIPASVPADNVVYGIEEQRLVFSEWLWFRTNPGTGGDPVATLHNESDTNHQFFYVELRNTSPYPVELNNETWRLVRYNGVGESITTKMNAIAFTGDGSNVVQPGGTFTIACHDGNVNNGIGTPIGSAIYVRKDGATADRLVPVIPIVADEAGSSVENNEATPEPLFDLDISHPSHVNRTVRESTTMTLVDSSTVDDFTVVLQRRKNTGWETLTQSSTDRQEEWIEVDRIEVLAAEFNNVVTLDSTAGATEIENQYQPIHSRERRNPFDRTPRINPWGNSDPAAPLVKHSMRERTHASKDVANDEFRGVPTGDDTKSYGEWQPHFDRDFSSAMELLSIPLYGYRSDVGRPYRQMVNGGPVGNLVIDNSRMAGTRTAQARILNPSGAAFPADHALSDDDFNAAFPVGAETADNPIRVPPYSNRWYRLLEFVDVKSQNELFSDQITTVQRRTPGKVNLNTIRHASVMAGLVDDPYHTEPQNESAEFMTQDVLESSRHWYFEHRLHRDGIDWRLRDVFPNLMIPGGLDAKPFRSLAYAGQNLSSTDPWGIESTILRQRDFVKANAHVDGGGYTETTRIGHGLYEARTSGDVEQDAVDYHTKNRILAKIANNATTRSHVFVVWMGIDLFKAHKTTAGYIQVGEKPTEEELPVSSYRMFCVVDMSRLEEAYNPINGTFDFRKFIVHRQLLP